MNKKGFTVVELITTVSMVSVVALLLVRLTISLKEMYIDSDIKTALISKQSTMTDKIYKDLRSKNLTALTSCGSDCINFVYSEGNKTLSVDPVTKTITYDNYSIKLPNSSSFGTFVLNEGTSGITNIKIPIKDRLVSGNFGLDITIQSTGVAIADDIDMSLDEQIYITLDPIGGQVSTNTVVGYYNRKYPTLPSPTRSGYTFKGWSIIPGGYTQLDFIIGRDTGERRDANGAYIDTNLKLYDGTSHEIYLEFKKLWLYDYVTLYGSSYDDDSFEGWMYSSAELKARYNNVPYGNYLNLNDSKHTLDLKGNNGNLSMTLDGTLVGTGTTGALDSAKKNAIFYLFKSGQDYGEYYLYKCKLYKDNTLVRDYIPAKKPDGTVGLYDIKNNVFYPSVGNATLREEIVLGSNKEIYVDSNTTVTNSNDHTLYAVWQKN